MIVFDITQFFLFLNHCLILLILRKAGYDMKISLFFSNYLVNRKTCYSQNGFTLFFFSTDVGIGQELALSYLFFITLIFHIFGKRIKNLKIPVSFLLFVDDRLFISQEKFFANTNANCFCSYNVIFLLLDQFGLIVEHEKTENFYFSRSYSIFNPPALDLSQIGSPILHHKDT